MRKLYEIQMLVSIKVFLLDFFFFIIYFWLRWVLVVAHGIFRHSVRASL